MLKRSSAQALERSSARALEHSSPQTLKRWVHPSVTTPAKLYFPKNKTFIIFGVQESFSSDTDAAAEAAATAAASAAAFVFTTVFTVVATVAAAGAAALAAAAVAAAPAAAYVSEEKDSWTLNVINVLVFGKSSFARGCRCHGSRASWIVSSRCSHLTTHPRRLKKTLRE